MGFLNIERRLRICGFFQPPDLVPGPVAFVSHSGSAFSAMLHNDRGLRFNLVVSAGQELVTTAADYVAYALGLESTKAIGLFIETVRDPDRFRSVLGAAADRDVPVVVLKVGREALTRELVTAHSGALAGEDGAYEALFDAYGVLRVESLDELADTLALMSSGRRAGPGGLASVHDSGGERALMVDAAASVGVRFAEISSGTSDRMAELLDEGLLPVNPLDFWGTGRDADEVVIGCMRALLADEDVAALAFAVDLTTEDNPAMGYIGMARTVFTETGKPMAMLSNLSSGIDRGDAKLLEEAGIPVLESTLTGLAAFRHRSSTETRELIPGGRARHRCRRRCARDGAHGWRAESRSESSRAWSCSPPYGVPVVAEVVRPGARSRHAQDGADARHQLLGAERLGDVVVAPSSRPTRVSYSSLWCGQHQRRTSATRAAASGRRRCHPRPAAPVARSGPAAPCVPAGAPRPPVALDREALVLQDVASGEGSPRCHHQDRGHAWHGAIPVCPDIHRWTVRGL